MTQASVLELPNAPAGGTWSSFQANFFREVAASSSNLMLNAVPGSGKTTTGLAATSMFSPRHKMAYTCFNTHNVNEAKRRAASHIDVRTNHSLGYQVLAANVRPSMNYGKYGTILYEIVHKNYWSMIPEKVRVIAPARDIISSTEDIVNAMRNTMEVPSYLMAVDNPLDIDAWHEEDIEGIEEMLDFYRISYYDSAQILFALAALQEGINGYKDSGIIDFSDMIFLPVYMKMAVPQYNGIIVDEAQDMNRAQQMLVLSTIASGGRFFGIGDPYQAIQGFAQADPGSFINLMELSNSNVMPLSVSYRCPVSHVNMVKDICPAITPRDGAPQGEIEWLSRQEFVEEVKPGDMAICRINAPLMSLALNLIARGIPAKVRGRNIGQNLISTIRQIQKFYNRSNVMSNFPDAVEQWRDDQLRIAFAMRNSTSKASMANDKADTIQAIFSGEGERIVELSDLIRRVERLFPENEDQSPQVVTFSSIHRAKGLEADTVHILGPELLMRTSHHHQPWEVQQERNVSYVAKTRSKMRINFVDLG